MINGSFKWNKIIILSTDAGFNLFFFFVHCQFDNIQFILIQPFQLFLYDISKIARNKHVKWLKHVQSIMEFDFFLLQ